MLSWRGGRRQSSVSLGQIQWLVPCGHVQGSVLCFGVEVVRTADRCSFSPNESDRKLAPGCRTSSVDDFRRTACTAEAKSNTVVRLGDIDESEDWLEGLAEGGGW